MDYLKSQNLFPLLFLAFLIFTCGVQDSTPPAATATKPTPSLEPTKPEAQDPTPQAQKVTQPAPSLEPTKSIEKVAGNAANTSKQSPLAAINYAIYTDARSNISIMYPENWKEISHENDVEFQGPTGDIIFEVLYAPFHELDQVAKRYFSKSDYQEEGFNIYQGGIDKTGAAALQFLIELGKLDSASILDGSMFHSCARELELTNDNPYVLQAKESWHMIENIDGKYVFRDQALQ